MTKKLTLNKGRPLLSIIRCDGLSVENNDELRDAVMEYEEVFPKEDLWCTTDV